MRYLSVCSGIEAATAAWHSFGWQAAAFSEIEPFPCSVLKHHYPAVPNLGDMTKFKGWPDANIDVLVGGTPCQSFSVAGLRKGLDDPRGNLMLTYLAIAERYCPTWVAWENVPGVLSIDDGRAFGALLGGLAKLGYGFAYRILDAQYFGVPQRRRRVFVVGCLGDWRRAAAVLFERHSLSGHPAPRRETGKGFTHDIAPSLTSSGRGVERGGDTRGQDPVVAMTLNAHGGSGRIDAESETFITHALRGEGFDASEDGTGRGTPLVAVDVSPTLNAGGNTTGGHRPPGTTVDTADSLIPMAFDCKASGQNGFGIGEIASTLRSMGHANSHQNGGGHLAVAMNLRGREGGAMPELDELASLRAASGGSSRSYVASTAVRRLTPRECERLQGFPDDYTAIPLRNGKGKLSGKLAKDGPRYKALGNSMAVPVMRWIGERINAVAT